MEKKKARETEESGGEIVDRWEEKYSAYHTLMRELALEDITSYKNYLLMYVTTLEELLHKVAPIIGHSHGTAVPPGERLALALRFINIG